MSMVPPIILEFRQNVKDGSALVEGFAVPDARIQQVLQESGWTLDQLDLDIKEHCLARRALSADGGTHFYEYLNPVDMPPVG